jgi:NAD+ synthase
MTPFRILMAQLNPTVGDIAGNSALIRAAWEAGRDAEASLVVTPEMAITGYPAEDLVLRPHFQQQAIQAIRDLAEITKDGGPALLVGGLWVQRQNLYNAALLLDRGVIHYLHVKHHLPNYGVFDEKRVFTPGTEAAVVVVRGVRLGILICEDMWETDLAEHYADREAELLICLNASPYTRHKAAQRVLRAQENVAVTNVPLIYVNQVGGQDELVFDGGSFCIDFAGGEAQDPVMLPCFESCHAAVDFTANEEGAQLVLCPPLEGRVNPLPVGEGRVREDSGAYDSLTPALSHRERERSSSSAPLEETYRALLLGLSDYCRKTGFRKVVLGLSGGIDSALTAVLAADALGPEQVHAVMMPSPYTGVDSKEDARTLTDILGIRYHRLPIQQGMQWAADLLTPVLAPTSDTALSDLTKQNLQSRLRGLLLMAVSNQEGSLLLTTGNKSEMAMGYATLYGDMCGGLNLLKDLYKTEVYALAHWRNGVSHIGVGKAGVIPERVLTRAPSAELKPGQTDQDTLPPYELLDRLLYGMIEESKSVDRLVEEGFDRATVERTAQMLIRAEYKRRQAAPGIKVSDLAFGRDWRYPIARG